MGELICCLLSFSGHYLVSRVWPEFTEMAAASKNRISFLYIELLNLIRKISTSGISWGRKIKHAP